MSDQKKKISIATGCYNEVDNLREFYDRCRAQIARFPQYDYEFVISDNCSTDGSKELLRELAKEDRKVKVILNANNFGHIRSPFNAFIHAFGDAVIVLTSDLQEPPEMIGEFIRQWEQGNKVVIGIRQDTQSSLFMEFFRQIYYGLLSKFAPGEQIIAKFTGFGLYDRCFMNALRKFHEPYPYFRGLVSTIGFKRTEVPFVQAARKHGVTKNNFFTLYDMAMTGFVNHTKLPLRLATLAGFLIGICSLLAALVYLVLKLCWWDTFQLGLAPLVIGMFFLGAVQLFFIGIIGEYLGAVWTQVRNHPLVIEEERLNFDPEK